MPAFSVVHGAAPPKCVLRDEDDPVHVRFRRHARARPEALAARFGAQSISYGALERAEQPARRLIAGGVRVESLVAVCLAPSIEVLVALLAFFWAHAPSSSSARETWASAPATCARSARAASAIRGPSHAA